MIEKSLSHTITSIALYSNNISEAIGLLLLKKVTDACHFGESRGFLSGRASPGDSNKMNISHNYLKIE